MAGRRVGYVRVSTFDQNPERRLDMKQIALLNVDNNRSGAGRNAHRLRYYAGGVMPNYTFPGR